MTRRTFFTLLTAVVAAPVGKRYTINREIPAWLTRRRWMEQSAVSVIDVSHVPAVEWRMESRFANVFIRDCKEWIVNPFTGKEQPVMKETWFKIL